MSGCADSMMFPKNLLGDLVEQLTGNELKVMLFLALRTNGFAISADGIRVREIAAATKLSKKEVRVALRMLTISAVFSKRFKVAPDEPRYSPAGQNPTVRPAGYALTIA